MAAAYPPVHLEENARPMLIENNINHQYPTSTKPQKKFVSFCPFLLIVFGLALIFFLGVGLGYFAREWQKEDEDYRAPAHGIVEKGTSEDKLGSYHESLIYFMRGKYITDFVKNVSGHQQLNGGSSLEERLAVVVEEEFNKYRLNSVEVEQHDVVVTSPDPSRPNVLEILHTNKSVQQQFILTNKPKSNASEKASMPSDELFPHVLFSPAGSVAGSLLYGHYGRMADFAFLSSLSVRMTKCVMLLRIEGYNVAKQVQMAESYGASAVILYHDKEDNELVNSQLVPRVSAAALSEDFTELWRPRIPCQTISTSQAEVLTSRLAGHLSLRLHSRYANMSSTEMNRNVIIRLNVNNKQKLVNIKNVISTTLGYEQPDRYVMLAAARSSPQYDDTLVSNSILVQVARGIHYVHGLHTWKPRRSIKLVSWGGRGYSNVGQLMHIIKHRHLLASRCLAYLDLSDLVVGDQVLTAAVSPSLQQLVTEAALNLPDPRNAEQTIQMFWQTTNKGRSPTDLPVQLKQVKEFRPFVDLLILPSAEIQYAATPGATTETRETRLADASHNYKFHMSAARVLTMSLLALVDNSLLPINTANAAQRLLTNLWKYLPHLRECSNHIIDTDIVLSKCKALYKAAKVTEATAVSYRVNNEWNLLRSTNDIKLLFNKHFLPNHNGTRINLLDRSECTEELVNELCRLGQAMNSWDEPLHFITRLGHAIEEARLSLQIVT